VAGFEPQGIEGMVSEKGHLFEKIAAPPTIASTIPITNSSIGKYPLPGSMLDRYARTKSTALRLNGAMILATFILLPSF